MLLTLIWLSACAPVTVSGGSGCAAYAEARLDLPPDEVLLAAPLPLLEWIVVDLDARMTGTCRP